MTSRSQEAGVERLAQLMERLLRGGEVSPRDFSPEIGEGILWTPNSETSLTEALILSGPPLVPLEGDIRRMERLGREGLIKPVAPSPLGVGSRYAVSPLRDVVLFSLAWMLLNRIGWGERIPIKDMRELYLEYMRDYASRWGPSSKEAFYLMSLGLEPLLSRKSLNSLVKLILYPFGYGGTAKGFLPLRSSDVPEEVSSKMLRLRKGLCVYLPVPKSETLELLRFAQDVGEIYGELRVKIYLIMRRLLRAKLPRISSLEEVLDQLSNELRDWSRRRKISLLGAKLRRKILRFYAIYPSAPDLWMSKQGEGAFERVGRPMGVSAIPWPFKERGVALISLETGDQVRGAS